MDVYAEEGQVPVVPDRAAIEALGVGVIGAKVISEDANVRHGPQKLAEVVLKLIDDLVAQRSSFARMAPVAGLLKEPAET